MDWRDALQQTMDYVETHITEELDYEVIAGRCGYSSYHFRWMFGVLCGCTLTEYIRNRRLTLAGEELVRKKAKVIDVALKYGYENPDSFARAFSRFHGVTPSQARRGGVKLRSVSMLSVKELLEQNRKAGELIMEYRIEEKPGMVLTGYKRHFTGVPLVTKEYADQAEDFYVHTRMNQMVLRYMSADKTMTTDYNIIDHLDEEGYDFWIAEQLTDWYHTHLAEDTVLGEDAKRFEDMVIPARKYAVFETEQCAYPTMKHVELRKRIAEEWLPTSGFMLADAPEINVIHWYRKPDKEKRYIELWLPVEEKAKAGVD